MICTSGGGGRASGGGGGGPESFGDDGRYTGGGGAGAIPLLVLIVMIDPGMVLPFGVVPTIVPVER